MSPARHDRPSYSGPTDAELLGDRAAPSETFSVFYRRHVRGVLAYCARQGLSGHDAADATADVFVAALTNRHKFDPSRGELATPWLYAIATNVMAGRHRKNARERAAHERLHADPIVITDRDLQDYAELKDEVNRALSAVNQLPRDERAAVIGRYLSDAEYCALAEEAGISEQAVRKRVSRALSSLRRRLEAGS
jgi:RNA polymerase sigma factor (sigma-70 family)